MWSFSQSEMVCSWSTTDDLWIGISSYAQPGLSVYVDYSGSGSWKPGGYNPAPTSRDCTSWDLPGNTWVDTDCDTLNHYVCQRWGWPVSKSFSIAWQIYMTLNVSCVIFIIPWDYIHTHVSSSKLNVVVECPIGWTYLSPICYVVLNTTQSFAGAKTACSSLHPNGIVSTFHSTRQWNFFQRWR